jgi:hypothetical protein
LAIINGCSPVNPRMPAWALPTLMNGIATTPANVSSLAWSGSVPRQPGTDRRHRLSSFTPNLVEQW